MINYVWMALCCRPVLAVLDAVFRFIVKTRGMAKVELWTSVKKELATTALGWENM